MEDHLHLLISLHPDTSLANFLHDLKLSSINWIKKENIFPSFPGWQSGYGAFTYAMRDKELIINYIINQQEHHKRVSFMDEYRALLIEAGIEVDDRYFP